MRTFARKQNQAPKPGSPGLSRSNSMKPEPDLHRNPLPRDLGNRAMDQVPSSAHEVLRSPGQPLDGRTRDFMETRFGHDFSHVRVHADSRAAESARAVNAVAYTVGSNIVFGTGRYTLGTHKNQYLLAHELAHVVQQRAQPPSRVDKLSMTGPGDAHELAANTVAEAVTSGGGVPSGSVSGTILARQV